MVEAVVEYHYEAQQPDELTLKKGDIISNIIKKPGGWWEGTLARIGKRGMFPDNFVKVLGEKKPDSPDKSLQTGGDKKTDSPNKVPAGGRFCKVLFAYTPNNSDELELKVGDVIEILGEVEEGWWKGKLSNTFGVFPSNFVTEITRSNSITSIDSKKHKANIDEGAKLTNSSSSNDEVNRKFSSDNTMTKADKDGEPLPALPPKPYKEQCRVIFPYKAANEDELTLEEGDIITIISKEAADDGWWTGELRGRIGVFPDNFVKLVPPPTTSDDSKIGVKLKNSKDSISKSSSSASVYMAAAAAASSNQGSAVSVSRKFSDSIRPSDDKPGSTASIGKKPPPPLKKPIGALSPSGGDKLPTGAVAAAIAKSEKAAAAAASLSKPKDTSPTSVSRSIVQSVVSSVSGTTNKTQSSTMTTSMTTNSNSTSNSSNESKWLVTETVASDAHDGIGFSRQSYTVTTSSGGNVTSSTTNSSGVSLNNGTIAPLSSNDLDLDSVSRTAMLTHPTASRAKVPKRRPPSALLQREDSRESVEPADALVNGSTDQTTVERFTSKAQSWVKELREKQKQGDPKKSILGGKTRVMIGASSEETATVATSSTSSMTSSSTTSSSVTSMSTTAATVSGVTLRERSGAVRPLSLHSTLPTVEPTSPSNTETITVSLPQWNQLCNRVSKLEALLQIQQEEWNSKLKDMMEKLEIQAIKQHKMSLDIDKLTDLVTQV